MCMPSASCRIRRRGDSAARRSTGFTLTEMVIVVAIIVVLISIVLPSVSRMWDSRKIADAQSTVRNALTLAKRYALEPDGTETGVLFVLDGSGSQRLYIIHQEAQPIPAGTPTALIASETARANRSSSNRFVLGEESYELPVPFRVLPRYVVEDEGDYSSELRYKAFNEEELASDTFPDSTASQWQEPQRHRNYFTMIFSTEGQLELGRDVLIHDAPGVGSQNPPTGERTGLPVSAAVAKYFLRHSQNGANSVELDPEGTGYELRDVIADSNDVAINFVSVDGLILYDNDAFSQILNMTAKREMLIETGIPYYVVGPSSAVVAGPIGENTEGA